MPTFYIPCHLRLHISWGNRVTVWVYLHLEIWWPFSLYCWIKDNSTPLPLIILSPSLKKIKCKATTGEAQFLIRITIMFILWILKHFFFSIKPWLIENFLFCPTPQPPYPVSLSQRRDADLDSVKPCLISARDMCTGILHSFNTSSLLILILLFLLVSPLLPPSQPYACVPPLPAVSCSCPRHYHSTGPGPATLVQWSWPVLLCAGSPAGQPSTHRQQSSNHPDSSLGAPASSWDGKSTCYPAEDG